MKNYFFLSVLVVFALACAQKKSVDPRLENFAIVPGTSVGPITGDNCSPEDLKRLYGEHAREDSAYVPGNKRDRILALFPDDPERRLEVWWFIGYSPILPAMMRASGQKSLWKTDKGLTLGLTLAEVEAINGGPFRLVKMPTEPRKWEVSDWQSAVSKDFPGIQFSCANTLETDSISLMSTDAALRAVNPTVSSMATRVRRAMSIQMQ